MLLNIMRRDNHLPSKFKFMNKGKKKKKKRSAEFKPMTFQFSGCKAGGLTAMLQPWRLKTINRFYFSS